MIPFILVFHTSANIPMWNHIDISAQAVRLGSLDSTTFITIGPASAAGLTPALAGVPDEGVVIQDRLEPEFTLSLQRDFQAPALTANSALLMRQQPKVGKLVLWKGLAMLVPF